MNRMKVMCLLIAVLTTGACTRNDTAPNENNAGERSDASINSGATSTATNSAATSSGSAATAPGAFDRSTIMEVQNALKQAGYAVNASGTMDTQTLQAVREFQMAKGLPTTGSLDTQTLRALNVNVDESRRSPASTDESVN